MPASYPGRRRIKKLHPPALLQPGIRQRLSPSPAHSGGTLTAASTGVLCVAPVPLHLLSGAPLYSCRRFCYDIHPFLLHAMDSILNGRTANQPHMLMAGVCIRQHFAAWLSHSQPLGCAVGSAVCSGSSCHAVRCALRFPDKTCALTQLACVSDGKPTSSEATSSTSCERHE